MPEKYLEGTALLDVTFPSRVPGIVGGTTKLAFLSQSGGRSLSLVSVKTVNMTLHLDLICYLMVDELYPSEQAEFEELW